MILKRYGSQLHSVVANFDARAMNEVGFQKSNELSLPADEFTQGYDRRDIKELTAEADGRVQTEAEQAVLASLSEQLAAIDGALPEGHFAVVENEQGKDYPKLREKVTNVVEGNDNKLHFFRSVDPPLRIGIYTPKKS